MQSVELASSSWICQKPELASRSEKNLAFGRRLMIASIVGRGKCSRWIAALRSLGSRQMRSLSGLTTRTMLLTHEVGSSCLTITSSCSMRWSSALTRSRRAVGTRRGGWTTGCAVSEMRMVCRPGRRPSAENRSGKLAVSLSLSRGNGAVGCVDGSMVSTRRSRSRSWHVRIPRVDGAS